MLHHAYPPLLMDLHHAAYYLGMSERQLAKLQALGDITPRANGSKRVFHRDDLDAYAAGLPEWSTRL